MTSPCANGRATSRTTAAVRPQRKGLAQLVAAGLFVAAAAGFAFSPPPLPSSFFGAVVSGGEAVPAGTPVAAFVGGAQVAEGEIVDTEGGTGYRLIVPGDVPDSPAVEGAAPGAEIEFRVGGAAVAERGSFASGDHVQLDLTAAVGPDLALSITDGVASVYPEGTLDYTVTVANLSEVRAEGVAVTALVPANTNLVGASGATVEGGTVAWTPFALEPGTSNELGFSVVVRSVLAQGTSEIVAEAVVRHDGSAGLDVERENDRATDVDELSVPPDFAIAVSDFTLSPAAPAPGSTVTLSAVVRNPGFVEGTAVVAFFDGRLERGTRLHEQSVTIPAGGAVTVTTSAPVTAETVLFSVYADPENDVNEVDEWNNEAERFVVDAPDLAIGWDNVILPATAPAAGATAPVRVVVRNAGRATARDFVIELYDGEPEFSGSLIGEATIDALVPGANRAIDLTWPSVEGLHYLTAVVDRDDRIVEQRETNNRVEKPLFVLPALAPDLTVASVDASGFSQSPVTLEADGDAVARVRNTGTQAVSGAVQVRLFEDRDGDRLFDEDDVELARGTIAGGLAIGAEATVVLSVHAALEFYRPALVVEVDPEDEHLERSEENNRRTLYAECEESTARALLPITESWWLKGFEVESTPIVVQLTDDDGDGTIDGRDQPEIVFHTEDAAGRAITARRGLDGSELWTLRSTPSHPIAGRLAHLSAADLDGDGVAEIVGVGSGKLFALDAAGHLLWTSAPVEGANASGWVGSTAIADLDGDGKPEIAVGRTVLSNTGAILAVGTANAAQSYNYYGPLGVPYPAGLASHHSVIADVDLDGRAELLAGDTLYRWNGSQLQVVWNANVPDHLMEDGFSAPGNLDGDPQAEIVYVSAGKIEVLNHTGSVFASYRWITQPNPFIQPTAWGGPPTIADLDGDGKPEILVAGSTELVAFRANLATYWRKSIDELAGMTAASVFDFEGDGLPEVVYRDQSTLWILDGRSGAVRYSLASTSKTGSEYPSIADVDADGRADLILGSNKSFAGNAATQGLHILTGSAWPSVRLIWNQHSYHQTNVLDDGTVPSPEKVSWSQTDLYRAAEPLPTEPRRRANLTIGLPRVGAASNGVPVTVRIGNGGRTWAPAGTSVRLFEGAVEDGLTRGQGTLGAPLAPGAFEDVTIFWNGPSAAGVDGTAVVDPDQKVVECDEGDNQATFVVAETLASDLALNPSALTSPPTVIAGQIATITARVDNLGNAPAATSVTWLFDGAPETGLFESATATPTIAPAASANVALVWDTLGATGARTLTAVVDANDALVETDESNNRATVAISLASPTLADLSVETLAINPPSATIGQPVTLTAEVANRGVALAQSSAVAFRVNKAEVSRQTLSAPLAHGGRRSLTFALDTLRYTGTLEIEAFADPALAIVEVTEANNSKKGSLVLATAGVSATLRTDKASYRSNQPVVLTQIVTNSGAIRDVALRVTIQTASGALIATVVEELRVLASGATTWPFTWSTGTTATGTYAAVAELSLDGVLVSRSSAPFTVLPDRDVAVTLVTDRSSYPAASSVLLDAAVRNAGVNDVLTGLKSTTRLLSPSGAALDSSTATLPSLAPGASFDLDRTWSVAKSPAGSYRWTLEVRDVTNVLVAYAETPFAVENSSDTGGGLIATLLVEPSPVGAGAPLAVEWATTNGGNSALAGLDLRLRALREDDGSTAYATTFDWPLALDETRVGAAGILTAGLAAGDYRIVLEALLPGATKQLATATVEVVLGVSIADVSVQEGDDDVSTAVLSIRLSEPAQNAVTVLWATADGSAVSGLDYLADGGLATIAAGELETTLTVSINGDLLEEAHEAFLVVLSSPSGAALGDETAVVELLDEEGCPSASLLANGDAELGSATTTDLPGWTATPAGSFGRRHGNPTPLSGGASFGSRGSGATASLAQTIDISAYADRIDAGLQEFVVEAFARGRGTSPTDSARMTIDYLDAAGAVIGSAIAGPGSGDAWLALVVRQTVPSGIRRAVVRLTATESAATTGLQVAFDRLRFRSLGVATASVSSPSAPEGSGSPAVARFDMTLSCPAPLATSLIFMTSDGTAAAPDDYSATSGTIELAEGALGDAVDVEIVADALDENDETFYLDIAPSPDLILLTPRAAATIVDDDGAVSLSVADAAILEGNAGTAALELTVSLSGPSGREVRVGYATVDDTAQAGTDYDAASGTLTFAPGETSNTVAIAVKGDVLDESTEAFQLVLYSPVNAALLDGEATGTIEDDDSALISVADAAVAEGNTGQVVSLVFPVSLSVPSAVPVSVSFATADGTALAGTHYAAKSGTLTIPAGSPSGSISVSVIPNTVVNADRTLALILSDPVGAGLADPEAIGTIRDDDGVRISIADPPAIRELDNGTATVNVIVSFSNHNSGTAITLAYTTVDDSAKAPSDYANRAGVLTVPAGTASATIAVPIVGDMVEEDAVESFRVVLSNPSSGLITDPEAVVRIIDNDIWAINGDARDDVHPGCIQLTPDFLLKSGSAWRKNLRADLNQHFDKTFKVYFGVRDSGAFGMIFALQNAGLTQLSGLNPANLKPVVSVEFDTNLSANPNPYDHTQWVDWVSNTRREGPVVPVLPSFGNIEDGVQHDLRVVWNGATKSMRASFDGVERIDYQNASVVSSIFGGDATVNYGFAATTSASGTARNEHYFCETAICPGTTATPQISVGSTSVVEGDTGTVSMVFPLTLNCGTDHPVSVTYSTVDGTATAGVDYIGTTETITFQPGEASKSIVVPVVGDLLAEANETLSVVLSAASGGTIRYGSAVGTILGDESALSVTPQRVAEGDSGSYEMVFTFRLNQASATTASFQWATANGTALAGQDYDGRNGTVSFAPGETVKRIVIPIRSDSTIEDDETFSIRISAPANVVAPSEFPITIGDDDRCQGYELVRNGGGEEAPPGLPGWTITAGPLSAASGASLAGSYRIATGYTTPSTAEMRQDVDISAFAQRIDSGTQRFRVQAFLRTAKDVESGSARVQFEFLDAGRTQVLGVSDSSFLSALSFYRRYSDTPTAPPNSRWIRIWVTAIHVWSNGTGFVDGTFDEISVRALDAPTVSMLPVSVVEGNAGQKNVALDVKLSCSASAPFSVDYQTIDDTAVAGADYGPVLGRLDFAIGVGQQTINVPIFGDTIREGTEAFTVRLLNPSQGGVATPSVAVTILDDEVKLSAADISVTEGDTGTTSATFTIALSAAFTQTVSVHYLTSAAEANEPGDFFYTEGDAVFSPGEVVKSVVVPIVGDVEVEPTETFRLILSNPINAYVDDTDATATIIDDDVEVEIDDASRVEGNSGSTILLLPVRLAAPSGGTVQVSFETLDLTAAAGADYASKSGSVTFAPGETLKTISLSVLGDTVVEPSEMFTVELLSATGAQLVDTQAVVTIVDDDGCPSPNVVLNPGAESSYLGDATPSWIATGGAWSRSASPAPLAGGAVFDAADVATTSLSQTIDLSPWAAWIDRGAQRFLFEGFLQTAAEASPDLGRLTLDYLAADGTTVLEPFDSGELSNAGGWLRVFDLRLAPEGARKVRVSLVATRRSGATTDVYFDQISLRSLGTPVVSVDDLQAQELDEGALDTSFTARLNCAAEEPVALAFASRDRTAVSPDDFGPLAGTVGFDVGETTRPIPIAVVGDRLPERRETFYLDLSNARGAVLLDAVAKATIDDADPIGAPVPGPTWVYTTDADFDRGISTAVDHDRPNVDQLQVSAESGTYPYIWVAASDRGTVVKIDTRSGEILGEYSTNPDGGTDIVVASNPSRTTVAPDGSVWVGNRADGSVVHVGLKEYGQCVDRNGNGVINTSIGYGNVLGWPNTNNADRLGGVSTAADECILHYVQTQPSAVRHLSFDRNGKLWIGGYGGTLQGTFQRIEPMTGAITYTVSSIGCGGYGGLVDGNGILWSAQLDGVLLRMDTAVLPPTASSRRCTAADIDAYGLALDPNGALWVTSGGGNRVWKVSTATGDPVASAFQHGSTEAQGLAVDAAGHVWVSSAHWSNGEKGEDTVGHLKNDGTFVGNVRGVPLGSTGVAIDANGYVWTANRTSSTASRIDPLAGPLGADGVTPIGEVDLVVPLPGAKPYNYSDMTGFQALSTTLEQGSWLVVQDAGIAGARWGNVRWNTEAQGFVPAGASIVIEVRAAESTAGLGSRAWVAVNNGVSFAQVGRYLQLRVTLRRNAAGASPVLSDLSVRLLEEGAISIGDATVTEGHGGSTDARFPITLDQPVDQEVRVSWATAAGTATAGTDFTAASGVAIFPAGATSEEAIVPVLGDTLFEGDETFTVVLSSPVNGGIGDGSGLGTIVDDDAGPILRVEKRAGLAVDAQGDGAVTPGDQVEYRLSIFNDGLGSASQTLVEDVVPDGSAVVSGSVTATRGSVQSESPVRVDLGGVGPGESAEVVFRVLVADPFPTGQVSLSNQAGLRALGVAAIVSDDPSTPEPLDPTVTPVVASEPELRATKVASLAFDADGDGQPSPGDEIGYELVVTNAGASPATQVVVRDPIPQHAAIVPGSIEATQGAVLSESPIEIDLDTIEGGGAVTIRFRATVANPLPAGVRSLVNQAFVSSAELPTVPSDDPAIGGEADPTETTLVAAPRLVLEKRDELAVDADGDEVASPGDGLEYTLLLKNFGNAAATDVVVSDLTPEHTAVELGSASTTVGAVVAEEPLEVEIGELAGGESVEIRFRVAIDLPIAAGVDDLSNQATASSAELADVSSDDPDVGGESDPTVTTVSAAPVLTVEKSDFLFEDVALDGVASPGDVLLYRIVVRNSGNTAATVLALDDLLDPATELELGSVQTSAGAVESESPLRMTLDELAAGATVEVTFRARIVGPFPLDRLGVVNQATLSCLELAPIPSDDPETEAPGDPTATEVFVRPDLAVSDAVAPESSGALAFVFTLAEPSNRPVELTFSTGDGNATAPADYGALAATFSIPAGATTASVPVAVVDDLLDEDDEQLGLSIASATGAIVVDAFAMGTILDDDLPPSVSVADAAAVEGSTGGTTPLAFAVTLSAPSGRASAVAFSTGDGSALAPADYQPASGVVAFPAGATAGTLVVPIVGDLSDEVDETFLVVLGTPTNLELGDAAAIGTIVDDDLGRLSVGDLVVVEGDAGTTDAQFALTLAEPAAREVSVDYVTTAGTATADVDFQPAAGRATIAAGASSTTVAVPVVGDLLFEDDETFRLALSVPAEAELVDAEATGTIANDDSAPAISIADAAVEEGDAGTVDLIFPVTLSAPSGLSAELRYQTAGSTATSGVDFHAFTGHLTIPAGDSTSEVRIEVVGDTSDELDETFAVELSNPERTTLADAEATGTILDDDLAQVSVGDVTVVEGDSGTKDAVFEIELAEPAAEAVHFDYATAQDTATEDFDYLLAAGTVDVPAGGSSATVSVDVVGDTWFEEDERFFLRLANPTAAELADAEGVGTIRNDEGCASANLVVNGGAETVLANGAVSSWTTVQGAWTVRWGSPAAAVGRSYFVAPSLGGEFTQPVDLAPFDRHLRNGDGRLVATGAVRLAALDGAATFVVELYDDFGALVASDTVGAATNASAWEFLELEIPAPAGTASALVRLVGSGYFDGVGLRVLGAPTLTIADATAYEPDSGSVPMPFALTLSCPIEPTARLTVSTSPGTAMSGLDYTTTSQSAAIPRGEVSAIVAVPILGDNLDEPFETLFLDAQGDLSVPFVVLLDGRGTGTIVGDDFCQRTIGYWKEHPEAWAVSALRIGATLASKPTLDAYLAYTGGDLTWRLAQQLTAAKLNLAWGSEPSIVATVEAADAFLVLYQVGTTVPEAARSEADRLKTLLDKYNNGCKTH